MSAAASAVRPGVDVPSDSVWHPERIVASPDASTAAFVVPHTRSGDRTEAGLWFGPLDAAPQRISADEIATNVVFSPSGDLIAYCVTVDERSQLVVRTTDGTEAARVDLPGIAESVRLDESAYYVLVAEPGADTASLSSGKPLSADAPLVRSNRAKIGWRRVWRVDPDSGTVRPVSPEALTVWQFELLPHGRFAAVAGDEPGEAGWYGSRLMLLGPAPSERVELHVPKWSIGALAVSADAAKVAFVEGWTSDRGLDTGDVFVLDIDTREVTPVDVAEVDVTWLRWAPDGALWFAGWRALGMAWGSVAADGVMTLHAADASLVNSRWHPEVVPVGADAALTVRSTESDPPEVRRLDGETSRAWSRLNDAVDSDRGFVVDEVRWQHDGDEFDGLLVRPSGSDGPLPTVVDVHGGPSLAYHHSWDLTWAETVVPAGYALFLPNPVGGTGHGQAFGRANLLDPAGAEFDQVLAGIEQLVADGHVDRDRLAVMGASYGGYLTAWALARGAVFRGGVVIAGMSNLVSCWATANNPPFYDRLCGGTPAEARELYVDRSPITEVSTDSLPSLILHGELDQCVPVSQARELFATLSAADRPSELVVYPGEGHQTQRIEHLHDQRSRILDFLAEILA